MLETDAELAELDAMFQAHLARANPHMLGIVTPDRRVNARQVAKYLVGTKHVAFASVNANGEPRCRSPALGRKPCPSNRSSLPSPPAP